MKVRQIVYKKQTGQFLIYTDWCWSDCRAEGNETEFYDVFAEQRDNCMIDCVKEPLHRKRVEEAAEHSCLAPQEQNLRRQSDRYLVKKKSYTGKSASLLQAFSSFTANPGLLFFPHLAT